ncbi:MAG: Mth938-like domain-containing protein [Candidatus Thiodiazotropha sp. (ex Cardiolucina cf. quadrata)]|nr:Mth938-like domain-containing protein [Candidatus Thiodiazotropha sp. (ex Cardiolucina cf. quadrata)]
MKFILDEASDGLSIQRYDQGEVTVSGVIYRENCIVLPDRIISAWRPGSFLDLGQEDFSFLAELSPEIVILGTGNKQHFPHPSLTQPLMQNQIGLEVMNTAAACRTYNILMSEGRRVAAALFMI